MDKQQVMRLLTDASSGSDGQRAVIQRATALLESRDRATAAHVRHTRHYVSLILRQLRREGAFPAMTPAFERNVITAAALHDVGKLFVSDSILNKPGKLTAEEYAQVKTHTVLGAELVDEFLVPRLDRETGAVLRDVVLCHHEKWDGSGYPRGLAGEEIPLAARIIAVSDVFDALVARRPYKPPMPLDGAMEILVRDSGSHFDGRIVSAFAPLRPELETYLKMNNGDGSC